MIKERVYESDFKYRPTSELYIVNHNIINIMNSTGDAASGKIHSRDDCIHVHICMQVSRCDKMKQT